MNAPLLDQFLQRSEVDMILNKLKGFGIELPRHPACMQDDWSLPFMRWVVAETTSGMEAALGTEDPPGVILSTHRDIVCDPALYNLARVEAGLDTTHIVLGTNLAGIPWVKEVMQLNKALFIDRSATGRAALEQQISLSNQIAEIVDDGGKVWIAQSPGRTKNGVDKTHPAILRMLALARGGEKAGAEVLNGLIRAVAIRYDVNPCDGRVVAERLRGEKLPEDDVASMLEGLSGWKGRVRLAETRPLTFDGMVGKEGWAEAALGVDAALEVLPIQGAWADAAKKGLSEGAEIADPGLASRVADIGAHVNAILPGMSDADIRECALEFYRESV
ncbi:MAG: 1-acyl-sn-glycerol-3-phosphate acyltransferase [Flavobacteriales bacterium]